jgi:hypothetical protein
MTERKPEDQDWGSFVERQIEDAVVKGEFANLPGFGKPFEFGGDDQDENWWIKQKLRQEKISVLPPALAIRLDVQKCLDTIGSLQNEDDVRAAVEELNERIRRANIASSFSGPPCTTMPLTTSEVIENWRKARHQPGHRDA